MKSYRTATTESFLTDHGRRGEVSFHMPGHKGSEIYIRTGHGDFLNSVADMDITEIPGADNLFHDDGILMETAKAYSRIYGVDKSYLLVNGTSCGIIAAVLASVPEGGRMIMARNSHKSVYNAARLGHISTEYVYPEMAEGIAGSIRPEDVGEAFEKNPDACALILPSPNYYGICSDIKKIAEIVHSYGAVLIVDQAHGAHLKLMENIGDFPLSAETGGADIIINSTHKTLASFTQSALLNVNSDRVNTDELEDRLQMVESSSPSYLLMGSMDVNRKIIEEHGERLFADWAECVDRFYDEAGKIRGIRIMKDVPFLDRTKLNIDVSGLGISGDRMENMLRSRNIFAELSTGSIVMCMTGIGTTAEHIDRLLQALREISEEIFSTDRERDEGVADADNVTEQVWTMRHSAGECRGSRILVSPEEAEGMTAADYIIPYPPGVPLVCRGEVITKEDCAYISHLIQRRCDVLGVYEGGLVKVHKVTEK